MRVAVLIAVLAVAACASSSPSSAPASSGSSEETGPAWSREELIALFVHWREGERLLKMNPERSSDSSSFTLFRDHFFILEV